MVFRFSEMDPWSFSLSVFILPFPISVSPLFPFSYQENKRRKKFCPIAANGCCSTTCSWSGSSRKEGPTALLQLQPTALPHRQLCPISRLQQKCMSSCTKLHASDAMLNPFFKSVVLAEKILFLFQDL